MQLQKTSKNNLLEIKNLSFKYFKNSKDNVINNLSLTIENNKVTLLSGPSGCGKSTLASIISGFYPNNGGVLEGEILINECIKKKSMIFQNPDLQFCMETLREELVFCLENMCVDKSKMNNLINDLIIDNNLSDIIDKPLFKLSGGEKQRAMFSTIKIMNSDLIVLDEPFCNIDDETSSKLIEMIIKDTKINKTNVIVIDHDIKRWINVVDEVIVFDENSNIKYRNINKDNFNDYEDVLIKEGVLSSYKKKEEVFLNKEILIELSNVNLKVNNKSIVNDINLSIYKGSCVCIVGKSGCGKTTLLKTLIKQVKYDGDIKLFNKSLNNIKEKELFKKVGLVFQNPSNQFVSTSVKEEMLLSNKDIDLNKELALMSLEGYVNRSPFLLSQGEQRRLAVLSMLVSNKEILMLDEPSYGQDFKQVKNIMDKLMEIKKDTTIIFTTHDMDLAYAYGDSIYRIENGEMKCIK